jgi:uncharacterized protein YbjT (DUF2867 family)
MYAITGITGKVGGEMAHALLEAGERVRAIVRSAEKGQKWQALGCEVALADMENAAALTRAFSGATAVFVLPPPVFDPSPGYPEALAAINSVVAALEAARPQRVLCLSTIGADAVQDNLLSQRTLMEQALRKLDIPLTMLRPAWFIDNVSWDVESAARSGVIQSFLQPLDKRFPMVAAKDVGRHAATLIREPWDGVRIVELEGTARVSPNDLAGAFATVLGRPVRAAAVPRATWESLFLTQGMKNPGPRMRMLDGFNEGWIDFGHGAGAALKGPTRVTEVIAGLVTPLQAADSARTGLC